MNSSCPLPPLEENIAGAIAAVVGTPNDLVNAKQLEAPNWSLAPDPKMTGYGQPIPFENTVQRPRLGLLPEGIGNGSGVSFYIT